MRTRIACLSALLLLFMGQVLLAQVSGVVNDADGFPDEGAVVTVKGEDTSTTTNVDGEFTIDAVVGQDVLVIEPSDGGENWEIDVVSNTLGGINRPIIEMEEAVVIAYGTKTKEEITGAVSVIDEKTIQNTETPNILKQLDGAVPGLQISTGSGQPGSGAGDILIRGYNSISALQDPLIVVDGVVYNGTISGINNKDIESVTVLKDASATSLYGSRAAGGVIIITTKRPEKGAVKFEFTSRYGVNERVQQDYDFIEDPSTYYEMYWQILRRNGLQAGLSDADARAAASANLIEGDALSLGTNAFTSDPANLVDNNGNFVGSGARFGDNWGDELFDTATTQELFFSAAGGGDKFSSYMSLGYLNEEGIVPNSSYQRITARLKGDYEFSENFKVASQFGYINSKTNFARETSGYGNAFFWTRAVAPIYPVYGYTDDGTLITDNNGNPVYDTGVLDDGIPGVRNFGNLQNPVQTYNQNQNETIGDFIDSRVSAEYKFLDGFKFRYVLGYENFNTHNQSLVTPNAGDAINVNGRVNFAGTRGETLTNQQLLTYNNKFGNHSVEVLVGHETMSFNRIVYGAERTNLLFDDVPFLDFAGNFVELENYQEDYRTEGWLSRLDYNYKNKYYLTGTFRRDASSVFHPDSRWGNFFSISGSWRISNESFMENVSWVNELRILGGYGTQGNDAILYPSLTGAYGLPASTDRNYLAYLNQSTFTYVTNPSTGLTEAVPTLSYLGNEDLEWEKSVGINVSLQYELFNRRLSGELTYFKKNTDDLLYNLPLAPSGTVGNANTRPVNLGEIQNEGFEMALNAAIVKKKNFEWSVNINATHYENEVIDIPNEAAELYQGIDRGIYSIQEGNPLFTFFLREYVGVDSNTGMALYNVYETDDDGFVTGGVIGTTTNYNEATEVYITDRPTDPDVYGGFGTFLRYEGFDLSAQFSYSLGGWAFDDIYQYLNAWNEVGANFHVDALNMWTPENTNSNIPIIDPTDQNNGSASTRWLISRDYLALNNVTIGYSLSNKVLEQINVDALRFYVSGQNLAVWSARQGFDPRRVSTGRANEDAFPLSRNISVGLQVSF